MRQARALFDSEEGQRGESMKDSSRSGALEAFFASGDLQLAFTFLASTKPVTQNGHTEDECKRRRLEKKKLWKATAVQLTKRSGARMKAQSNLEKRPRKQQACHNSEARVFLRTPKQMEVKTRWVQICVPALSGQSRPAAIANAEKKSCVDPATAYT